MEREGRQGDRRAEEKGGGEGVERGGGKRRGEERRGGRRGQEEFEVFFFTCRLERVQSSQPYSAPFRIRKIISHMSNTD